MGSSFWAHWKNLGSELKSRIKKPFSSPSFVLYFLGVILLVGGLGIWISIYKNDWQALPRDLSNYLLAILSAAAADLTIFESSKRPLQMIAFVSLFLGIALASLGHISANGLGYSIAGILLALFLWWVANADNIKLRGLGFSPDAATGGDPHKNLKGKIRT